MESAVESPGLVPLAGAGGLAPLEDSGVPGQVVLYLFTM